MSRKSVVYRPPDTDSEDEYDGFYFGDEIIINKSRRWTQDTPEDYIYEALKGGDLKLLKESIENKKFHVDEYINGGLTPLLLVCKNGHVEIAEYLLDNLQASPNKHYDSNTPLMFACDLDDKQTKKAEFVVEKLVRLLLKHGAEVDLTDKFGTTAFMLACKHGYLSAVRLMIKSVSFDNVDNNGCTPIFFAIENNHPAIVKLLVEAGANTKIPNDKGYTPYQVAQFHGFYDLLELLPKQKEAYTVPSNFLNYNTLRDIIPRLFLKSDCPEYFQEIYSILMALRLEKLLEFFAKERISLEDFLCISDERLKAIGIVYPIHRMKILKGLLDFHLHYWKTMNIGRVHKSTKDNFYEILIITANHLQNLIILKSSVRYIGENLSNNKLGPVQINQIYQMKNAINNYRESLKNLQFTAKYLSTFSPEENPLYIDYDKILKERRSHKIKKLFKFTTLVIGISVFICFKIRVF